MLFGRSTDKNGPQSIGISRGGRNTKIHLIVANETTPVVFQLSPGQAADDLQGRVLTPPNYPSISETTTFSC